MKKSTALFLSLLATVSIGTATAFATGELVNGVQTVQAATQYQSYSQNVYVNYDPGYSIAVFDAPGGSTTGTMLKDGTSWKTFQAAKTDDGRIWYNLGGKQWINAQYAAPYRVTKRSDNVKVYDVQDVALWTAPMTGIPFNEQGIIKLLSKGSTWRAYGETTVNGEKWVNLGGNQWVKGQYLVNPSSTAQQIVALAKQQIGIRYVWGGSSPSEGFDCSGLVYYVFGKVGISLPRTSQAQSQRGYNVAVSISTLQPGDLLFFNGGVGTAQHVAIYIGGGQFIQAPAPGDYVKITNLNDYWPAFARRVL